MNWSRNSLGVLDQAATKGPRANVLPPPGASVALW